MEISKHFQEEARVETVRKGIEETTENEVTLAQWAKVVGMSRNSLDKVLCDCREAQERITRCYRNL